MSQTTPADSGDFPQARPGIEHTILCLIAFYLLGALTGMRSVYQSTGSRLDVLLPIAYAFCLGAWVVVDARRRGHPFPMLTGFWVCSFAVIVTPVYLIWSRKWWGVVWLILNVVQWYLVVIAGYLIGGRLIYGPTWNGF